MIESPFVTVTAPLATSTVNVPSEPTFLLVPLTFTPLPEAAVVPPNTSVSFPADGAVNLILVDDSILRHFVSVRPLYVAVPLFVAMLPVIL